MPRAVVGLFMQRGENVAGWRTSRGMEESPHRARRFARSELLSSRERAVLEALATGHSTATAAAALCLSPHTVRTYLSTAMGKLGARTRTHAVAKALARGEIQHGEARAREAHR